MGALTSHLLTELTVTSLIYYGVFYFGVALLNLCCTKRRKWTAVELLCTELILFRTIRRKTCTRAPLVLRVQSLESVINNPYQNFLFILWVGLQFFLLKPVEKALFSWPTGLNRARSVLSSRDRLRPGPSLWGSSPPHGSTTGEGHDPVSINSMPWSLPSPLGLWLLDCDTIVLTLVSRLSSLRVCERGDWPLLGLGCLFGLDEGCWGRVDCETLSAKAKGDTGLIQRLGVRHKGHLW